MHDNLGCVIVLVVLAAVWGVAQGFGKVLAKHRDQLGRWKVELGAQNAKWKADLGAEYARRKAELEAEYAKSRAELEAKKTAWNKETQALGRHKRELDERDAALERRATELDDRDAAFRRSLSHGRMWMAHLFADADAAVDKARKRILTMKGHPAPKAVAVVQQVKAEKRDLIQKLKFLEYQLASYEEYFPQLADYREVILDEQVPLRSGQDNIAELERADPVRQFLSTEEYSRLSSVEKNQLALDRYLARDLSDWQVGRLYERFLGWRYEETGWTVTFQGALRGFEDLGRDLICQKGKVVHLVQAKCWSKRKEIHEKHVFQLFGTTVEFELSHPEVQVVPILTTTTKLSAVAEAVARRLGVHFLELQLDKTYPMIKCNVNTTTGERIYHLPIDQQYDRVVIGNRSGECYIRTVREAEDLGFRRAWRYHPDS